MISYLLHLLTLVSIWFIIGLGFQLAMGGTGIINLAHISFVGVGAYAFALFSLKLGVPPSLALFLAALAPLPLAYFMSILTAKVKGDYLVAMSLWLLFVVYVVLLNWTELTRGALGIPGILRPSGFVSQPNFALLALIFAAGSYLFGSWILKSPFGRVMAAVRDDELQAATLGKDTHKVKRIAYLLSAFMAGIGGALLAMFLRFIDPSSFFLPQVVLLLSIVIVGGLASIKGTALSAVLLLLLPEILRFLPVDPDIVGAVRQGSYALLLLLIVMYRPKGILGKVTLE